MENLTKSQYEEIMARAEALAAVINCPITDAVWRATEILQFKK